MGTATATSLGVIKVGSGLYSYADGTLNAYAPGFDYGNFYSTLTTVATLTTAIYAIPLEVTYESNNISITSSSYITVVNSGSYIIEYSLQFISSDTKSADVNIWFRKNNQDVGWSNSIVTVPSKQQSSGKTGKILAVTPFAITTNANDKIQIMWNTDSTNVSLADGPATTNPDIPGTPSAIVIVRRYR